MVPMQIVLLPLFTIYLNIGLLNSLLGLISELRTIQSELINFTGQYRQREWGPTFASICLAIIPTLVLYLILNKRVSNGMTSGAVKG